MPLYEPLQEGSVRLLRLLPHSHSHTGIKCQLFTCPLLNSGSTHPYDALSYVWGPENNQQSIYIDNCEFSVRANLYAALSYLQDRFIERIIWIDAICINQDDNDEKGQQVQSMAKIYAKANRVIVWLGEAAGYSNQALRIIRKAAEEQHANSAIDEKNPQAILNLLKREWFQRIWVLQEVAAARHILIKCGPMEIDGYTFCSGLSALQLSYETCHDLQGPIRSVAYLIRGAIFRPRDEMSQPGRFSLNIRPLGELMDMYHTHKATERHDKVYALLGMSSDDPSTAGLLPNYKSSWQEVFRKLIKFSASDQISVDTWDDKEAALIKGKACILGEVSLVERDITRDDTQSVDISWKRHFDTKGERSSHFTFPASAKSIQEGDVVCLLQGASKPSIVRPCNGYSAIIMIAVPLLELIQSTITFPNHILLIWDWNISQGKSQDGGYYKYLISSREKPGCPRTECKCQDYLDEATRLLDFGLLLNGLERYEEAGKNFRKAVEVYGIALRSVDNDHGPWREADKGALRAMNDLLIEDKGADIEPKDKDGGTPLSQAAGSGHEAFVRLLLNKGADIESKDKDGRTPLSQAAGSGHEAIVRLLLDRGADIESKDNYGRTLLSQAAGSGHEAIVRLLLDRGTDVNTKNKDGQTPLSWAAKSGHEAVVRLLLDKGADVDTKDNDSWMLLWRAARSGHEAVVRLLLNKGADVDAKDNDGWTPLSWAARSGHEAVVRLLLDKGADVDAKDNYGWTPLSRATINGHEAVVRLLLNKGADVNTKDNESWTPLSWAAISGHEAVVRLLLDKGADINAKDNYGRTPLWRAAKRGHEAVVRLLEANLHPSHQPYTIILSIYYMWQRFQRNRLNN